MRFSQAGAQWSYSGIWAGPQPGPDGTGSTASSGLGEQVFGVFRNSFTKTATITAASFVRGNPAILTVASASNNGYDIVHADTAGQDTNHLFVGVVADFPDTTILRNGNWQPEDWGTLQLYGINTFAVVANATATINAPVLLTPNTGSQLLTIATPFYGTGTASTVTHTALTGIGGLAVLIQTLATSSAAGTTAAKVFLRCL